MTAVETWLRQGRKLGSVLKSRPEFRKAGTGLLWGWAGFVLSAAALGNAWQTVALGLVMALSPWESAAAAAGGVAGYALFWGQAGAQGMVLTALGWMLPVALRKLRRTDGVDFLLPAAAGFLTSAVGLGFQMLRGDETTVGVYLLRVAMAAGTTLLFTQTRLRRDSPLHYAADAMGILALAQVVPFPWLALGWVAAGWVTVAGELPGVILSGMALDVAGVTAVPMTVALSVGYLLRRLPVRTRWARWGCAVAAYCLVMAVSGVWDPLPLAGLALGGVLAGAVPLRPLPARYRGHTGMAQVRLELAAGVLEQSRNLLAQAVEIPPDGEALIHRVRERACGGCPHRKQCRDLKIPAELLERPIPDNPALPFPCKKPGRMVTELRRGQEQLRFLQGEHRQRREYRDALVQQYGFLGEYLREQSDRLAQRGSGPRPRLRPEIAIRSMGKEPANGDYCGEFPGTQCRHYVLLCDGMGTGLGAAEEGQTAGEMLRQLLEAGFPPEYALRSLNSLLILTGRSGATTVDLAEIRLDTGRITLYKWGAAPSYLLRATGVEKIGTAGAPPGLSVTQARETTDRLSLRRGEALILFSDGVDAPGVLHREGVTPEAPSGEVAARLLERREERGDDATVAVIRLLPGVTSAS